MSHLPQFWNAIINPRAFNGKSLRYWLKVKSTLWQNGFTFNECDSPSSASCSNIISQLYKQGETDFLVVGGDGTLNQVVNALLKCHHDIGKVNLAVVPAGTGNDWARTHRISDKPEQLLKMFKTGQIISHDVGKLSVINKDKTIVRYFVNMAGLGFDAEVIRRIMRTKQIRYGSKLIYLKNLIGALTNYEAIPCKLLFNNSSVHLPVFTIAAGICKYNGNGMMQVPMAEFDNGLLDIVYIEKLSFGEVILQLPKLFKGRHIGHRKVHHCRTKSMTIIPQGKMYAETEGEITECGNFDVECIGQKLSFLVPSG